MFAIFLTTNGAAVTDPTTNAKAIIPRGVGGDDPTNGIKPNNWANVLGGDAVVDCWDELEDEFEVVVPVLFCVMLGVLEVFDEFVDVVTLDRLVVVDEDELLTTAEDDEFVV